VGPADRDALEAVFARAARLGFVGEASVDAHLVHSEAFGAAVEAACGGPPASFLDLGSGAGIPGLVLAARWPGSRAVLLDAHARRCEALVSGAADLGLGNVEVMQARAENLAREPGWREHFVAVTARAFGRPAVTAECASGFLEVGGVLVVSEPPDAPDDRWPREGLATLALAAEAVRHEPVALRVLRKTGPTPDAVPRGEGRPQKRPRW